MSIKPITKPDGFFKQRLDNFVKGVTENKKDAQNKKLQEEIQKFVASAQGYLQQNDVPDFPEQMPMGNMMTAQVRGQIPWQAPYGYPSLQNPKVAHPELFVTAAEKYKTNSLQNIGQTLVDTFVAPAYYQYMSAQEKAAKEAKDKEEAAATQQEQVAPNDWSIGVSSPEYIPDGTNQTSGVIKQKGGKTSLHKYQIDGQTWQSQLFAGLPQESQNQIMQQANVSDISELTNEQLNAILPELYNNYYSQVGEAFKNNQVPSFGGPPDLSFISNYPIMQGLKMPGTDLSGPGASPEMLTGRNYAPFTTTQMAAPEMGLADYMGLRQGRQFDLDEDSVKYDQGFSQKLQEALDSGDYDRIQKSVTANPTVAGKLLDKIGIGKMFDTRNYDTSITVLPEGQSVFDNYDWEKASNEKVYAQNAKSPGGGLMQTDQLSPDLWQNISRDERRELLNEAGIDPNRKNLRGMGRKFLKNEAAMIESERPIDRSGMKNIPAPGSGSGMITIPGTSMQIDINNLPKQTEPQVDPSKDEPPVIPPVESSTPPKVDDANKKEYNTRINMGDGTLIDLGNGTYKYGSDETGWSTSMNREVAKGFWQNGNYNYTPQKKLGGSQLPSFKGNYGPSTFGIPDIFGGPGPSTGPFQPGKATDKKSFFDFIGAKTDNPLMVGSQDQTLNLNGTNKENSYAMGEREVEKSVTATGSGKVKNPFNAIPTLNLINSGIANIATPFFNRKEKRNADLAMRNAFMPENTESASPDVRDADRLGYNTFTGAPEGGGLAGSPVQFSSGPLRAFAQRGMQMPRLQVGGSIYLTQDMIDDIISNGGEIEYED
jgi:hypothetical protein